LFLLILDMLLLELTQKTQKNNPKTDNIQDKTDTAIVIYTYHFPIQCMFLYQYVKLVFHSTVDCEVE